LPPDAPNPVSPLLGAVDAQVARWRDSKSVDALTTSSWSTQEWLHFLEAVAPDLDRAAMADLDERFALTTSGNAEILCVWLRLSIQHGYSPADGALREFLGRIGRRKLLTPLYKELMKTADGRVAAQQIYATARPRYHSVSRGTLDGVVGWDE
jgi:hypothetical protein